MNHHHQHYHPGGIWIYMRALWWLALVVRYTSIIVKRFQSFPSLSNYLCPPCSWQEEKSRFRTIIDLLLLLLLLLSLFFSLLFELLDTIRGRSSETNLVKRVKKQRKRRKERERRKERMGQKEKIFTLLMHTFIEYIYFVLQKCLACVYTCYVRIIFCTF